MLNSPGFLIAIRRLNVVHYTLINLALTIAIVSGFSVYFHGRVTTDFMVTGIVTSVIVCVLIVGMLRLHQRALDAEIARRKAAEKEKDRLIELLKRSLRLQQELADLQSKEKISELQLTIGKERLRNLQQVMTQALQYVNNLAVDLQVISLEYREQGSLSEQSLNMLDQAILDCSRKVQSLARTDDPLEAEFLLAGAEPKAEASP